ncbi:crotonase/enoyl-CoA hydratase family protein [Hydrogenophaga sp. BPS33]|uniref:crotonase/enoyl-CoA hydratase family protein n=1 Tax=Hydrogenophaga sp. BPS33 TaxID=2651974 RepID=UPI00131F6236|nr:crotonase/enoyl-CoA hydratase family protein [Hydrogenophaga sp. BPS33]QHE84854.1 crotonase/enoyl-CoA hydratase family protein [Hydrogenophaga sp. BPS33]
MFFQPQSAEAKEAYDSGQVQVEFGNGLVIITINRPEVRNSVNRAVSYGVCEAIDELDRNPELRVGILTGAGGNFCAGMDLKAFLRGEQTRVDGRGILGIALTPPRKPVICAVEGYALAGGFESVLACDLVVAAKDAQFGLPEVKRGLAAAAGGLLRLPRVLPKNVAMEVVLTGNTIGAQRLHHFGVVNVLSEPGEALADARALALQIVANAPMSLAASKRVMVEQQDWPLDDMFTRQKAITDPVLSSEDAQEGARAFAQKRPARWMNR